MQQSSPTHHSSLTLSQVRAFAKERAACMRYDRSIRKVLHQGLLSARAGGFFFGFNFIVGTGAIVCVLWFGARQVVDGNLSPGELSSFVIYALYVGANTGALAGVVSSLIQVRSGPCLTLLQAAGPDLQSFCMQAFQSFTCMTQQWRPPSPIRQ